MISSPGEQSGGAAATSFAGTCEDFARALGTLGAGIEPDNRGSAEWTPRRVRLDCSYEQWAQRIGQVPAVASHFAPCGGPAFQAWEYRCLDGRVQCIGRKHINVNGNQFVSVRAVYFGGQDHMSSSFHDVTTEPRFAL
jgi:hypothetical protein